MFEKENCFTYMNDDCYYMVSNFPEHYEDEELSFEYYPTISFEVAADEETLFGSMIAAIHPNAMQDQVRTNEILYPEGLEALADGQADIFTALSSHAPAIIVKSDSFPDEPLPWEDISTVNKLKKEYEVLWNEVVEAQMRPSMKRTINQAGTTNHDIAKYLLTGCPYWC